MYNLANKVAVITGGGSGIGKSIALLFAKHRASVIIIDLQVFAAEELMKEIESQGGKAKAFACDVSDLQIVNEVFDKVIDVFGKVDILINNAGVAHVGNLEKTSPEDFERIFNINVRGVYNCLRAAVPHMKNAGGGVILNLASVASSVGIPERFAYSMSKGAVAAMTLSIARDYVQDNIRCNCISPGRVHTPFVDNFLKKNYPGKEQEMFDKLSKTQPIGRMGTPDEIAHLALYLCSEEASFVTGSNYAIDGGFVSLK